MRRAAPITSAKESACLRNLEAARLAISRREFPKWTCAHCGVEKRGTVHQLRKTYCSAACMSAAYAVRLSGSANPNFKDAGRMECEQCGGVFHSYIKTRRFCSLHCRDEGAWALRTGTKKDANHGAIVELLERGGAFVVDLSKMGHGVPDILVWHRKAYHLIEIKNPKTSYGKRGLSARQEKWAKRWMAPVYVVRTDDDARAFLAGRLDQLESVCGYTDDALRVIGAIAC